MFWKPVQLEMFSIFWDFCQLIIVHPVYVISPCSFPDFSSLYDILNLADLAHVFVANFIPQNIPRDTL